MANKLISVCKRMGLEPTPTIRELAAVFDPLMPLLPVAGAAIGPGSLALALGFEAEDKSGPLYLLRPPSLFAAQMVVSMTLVCTQASLVYLATAPAFQAPPPEVIAGMWATTPAGLVTTPSAIKFALVMGTYISEAFEGGTGDEEDAPPPPAPYAGTPPPKKLRDDFDLFGYSELDHPVSGYVKLFPNLKDVEYRWGGQLVRSDATGNYYDQAGLTSAYPTVGPEPRVPLIFGWSAQDPNDGDADVSRFIKPDPTQARPEFRPGYTGTFTVRLTVCSATGTLSDTRTNINVD